MRLRSIPPKITTKYERKTPALRSNFGIVKRLRADRAISSIVKRLVAGTLDLVQSHM